MWSPRGSAPQAQAAFARRNHGPHGGHHRPRGRGDGDRLRRDRARRAPAVAGAGEGQGRQRCTRRRRSPPRSTTAPRRRPTPRSSACGRCATRPPAGRSGSTRRGRSWVRWPRRSIAAAASTRPAARALRRPRPVPRRGRVRRAGRQPAGGGRRRACANSCARSPSCAGPPTVELTSLKSRQAELKRRKKTVTGKLAAARRLLCAAQPPRSGRATRSRAGGAPGSGPPALGARPPGDLRRSRGRGPAAAPNSRAAAAVVLRLLQARQPLRLGRHRTRRLRLLGPHPGRVPLRGRVPAPHDVRPDQRRPARRPLRTPARATWCSSTRASAMSASTWATAR